MPTVERLVVEGTRRGMRRLVELADEYRERRITLGLTQNEVAGAIGISRSGYSRIEGGRARNLSVLRASQIGRVLGLDVVVRAYPGPPPLRDSAHAQRLERVLSLVEPPLSAKREVPLPQRPGAPIEQRAWDAMIIGSGRRTAVEMEMRLRDMQALERRLQLKLRDDPVDAVLVLVAGTRTNREALQARSILGRPVLTIGVVLKALRAGQHPPGGVVLV